MLKKGQRVLFGLAVLFVAGAITVPVWYSLNQRSNPNFLENFMGNWSATMIGVIIGIPIAIWISGYQQREQEKKEQETQEREGLARKTRILKLVREELRYNREQLLKSRTETDGVTTRTVF